MEPLSGLSGKCLNEKSIFPSSTGGGAGWGSSFVCHSEGATRSGSMAEWKIFIEMLIKILATEENH